ncbi:hypothetical protein [Mycobacterium sp. UM_CSW]|uniref:hypothetical protein n=1 Tax=Mycobacterium sp. UM_CSW TaxID=1370119 RepID=UPI0004092711|nr:hypothetical protein [Mycobacterium sp. UM_CSW]
MRFTYFAAAVGIAIALLGASPAHADYSGFTRCVGGIKQLPLNEPDPQNFQRVGVIEQDLKSGVSPAAEAQKVAGMGFDQQTAATIVQCIIEENP